MVIQLSAYMHDKLCGLYALVLSNYQSCPSTPISHLTRRNCALHERCLIDNVFYFVLRPIFYNTQYSLSRASLAARLLQEDMKKLCLHSSLLSQYALHIMGFLLSYWGPFPSTLYDSIVQNASLALPLYKLYCTHEFLVNSVANRFHVTYMLVCMYDRLHRCLCVKDYQRRCVQLSLE